MFVQGGSEQECEAGIDKWSELFLATEAEQRLWCTEDVTVIYYCSYIKHLISEVCLIIQSTAFRRSTSTQFSA